MATWVPGTVRAEGLRNVLLTMLWWGECQALPWMVSVCKRVRVQVSSPLQGVHLVLGCAK